MYRIKLMAIRSTFVFRLIPMVLSAPAFINGVQTPLLATIPPRIILSGWIMGHHDMALIGFVFAVARTVMWFAQFMRSWEISTPLRASEVWLRAFLLDSVYYIVTVAAVLGNYRAELRRRFALTRD